MDATHDRNASAYVILHASGAVSAGCHHARCQWWGWRELRQKYEPEAARRQQDHDNSCNRSAQSTDSIRTPALVCLANVKPQSVDWLWYPRLPKAKLGFLDGDPGITKGLFIAAVTATVTTGARWPDGADCTAGNVILLNAEDGAADTLRPRLDAAGADVSRVHLLTGYHSADDEPGKPRVITLADVDVLRAALEKIRPQFVNVDPIQAYLGAKLDMHRANEVRPLLAALAALAEEYGCMILATRHLTKGTRDRALYRGLGSIDFAAAARSVLVIGLAAR